MAGRWVDVGEAARELDISTDAVRKRIARGSLESDRPNGHVLVWLDGGGTETDKEAQGERRGELVEMLTDQVAYLRSQLDQERQAHAEARRIIGGLVQRVPELEASGESSTNAPEARVRPPEDIGRGTVHREHQTDVRPRSWWRRSFE